MSAGIPPTQDSIRFFFFVQTEHEQIAMETHNPLFEIAVEGVDVWFRHTCVLSFVSFDPNATHLR